MTFARGVSRGMKMCASRPARAAYAASAPAALPADGTASFCAPEGAACLPALRKLQSSAAVSAEDRVVLFNTGSGVKYVESFS